MIIYSNTLIIRLYAGPEVDVWSCGVILYALLCGFLPFDEGNIKELFRKIKTGDYPLPEHASPGAQRLVGRMLETDPMHRISVDEIIADSWFREDLPPGIILKPRSAFDAPLDQLDADVARRVEDMGYDGDMLRRALSLGPDLLTRPPACASDATVQRESEALRQLAVTYHLLADQLRAPNQAKHVQCLGGANNGEEGNNVGANCAGKNNDAFLDKKNGGEEKELPHGVPLQSAATTGLEAATVGVRKNQSERAFGKEEFLAVDGAAMEREKREVFVAGQTIDVVSDTSSEDLPDEAFCGAPEGARHRTAKSWAPEGALVGETRSWQGLSWALGLRCTAQPVVVMREVLAALRTLRMV